MNAQPRPSLIKIIANPRIAAVLMLSFSSGLPLNLSGSTLQAWLATLNVDIETIGFLSLVSWPYLLKFLWAPLLDRYVPPFLGRRRGWILLFQLGLAGAIAFLGIQSPSDAIYMVGAAALLVAFMSATQDIVIDAYRTDVLHAEERGLAVTASTIGYRVASVLSGAVALVMSDQIGWRNTYLSMAAIMALLTVISWSAPEPERRAEPPRTLTEAVVAPLRELLGRPTAIGFLVFALLYKVGDAFALSLYSAFLIQGVGFTPTEVGAVGKTTMFIATLLGGVAGGLLYARLGLFRSLLTFGLLQAVTNLLYMALAVAGRDFPLMVTATAVDNFVGGAGLAAYTAFLMALCNVRFSAFQYALLSALSAVPRVVMGWPAGIIVKHLGWPEFFAITVLAAIPGLVLLVVLRRPINEVEARDISSTASPQPAAART